MCRQGCSRLFCPVILDVGHEKYIMSLEVDDVRAWLLELGQIEAVSLLSDAEFEYTYIDTTFRMDAMDIETEILELSIRVPPRIYRGLESRFKEVAQQVDEAIAELTQHTNGCWIRSSNWLLRMPKIEEVESSPETSEIFEDSSLFDIQRLWTKAKSRAIGDPDGAITASKTMIESLCKIIIDESGDTYTNKDDFTSLYCKAVSQFDFAPNTQTETEYRKLAGACSTIINSISCIRNRESDSHASDKIAETLQAKFVVNIAGSIALFLVGLRKEKNQANQEH